MRRHTSRREFLLAAGGVAAGLGLGSIVAVRPARATPAEMQEAIRKVVGSAPVSPGKVKLDLPPLIENGNAVPLTVDVASPMTGADHVRAIHVFTQKNPQPNVVSFHLGPRAGSPLAPVSDCGIVSSARATPTTQQTATIAAGNHLTRTPRR